jgi:hypothetical protein
MSNIITMAELSNPLLYTKMEHYFDFVRNVYLGDTYVSYNTQSVITRINREMIISTTEAGKTVCLDINFAYNNRVPIYKYIGPTAKNLQQKQDTINQLGDCLMDARHRIINEEGCISFIGEDYRLRCKSFYANKV